MSAMGKVSCSGPQERFEMVLNRRHGEKLGISVAPVNCIGQESLTITSINQSALAASQLGNLERGDLICNVNGVSGHHSAMLERLANDSEIKMEIVRLGVIDIDCDDNNCEKNYKEDDHFFSGASTTATGPSEERQRLNHVDWRKFLTEPRPTDRPTRMECMKEFPPLEAIFDGCSAEELVECLPKMKMEEFPKLLSHMDEPPRLSDVVRAKFASESCVPSPSARLWAEW
mmetsp:Transcript_14746/g.33523  ORF Transcript_14746/g.33523 Transcript_14746/m.33523 type:complete len:230 (-) Transcript_14746:91-780(-)